MTTWILLSAHYVLAQRRRRCSVSGAHPLPLVPVPEPHASPEQFAGWLPTGQRADTAPLARDNSRVRPPDPEPEWPPFPEEATRPAFTRPGPATPPSGHHPPPSRGYPGTLRQPTVPPAPQAPLAPVAPQRKRISPLGWLGRGLVLVAISVVSGLIWSAIKPHHPSVAQPPPGPQTKYHYTLLDRGVGADACKSLSTGQVKEFFTHGTECQSITRQLFTTQAAGKTVLASVITVTMPDATSAARLQSLAKGHDTGQVLALTNTSARAGHTNLNDDVAYRAQRSGSNATVVVISDAGYFGRDKQPDADQTLSDVSADAVKLG